MRWYQHFIGAAKLVPFRAWLILLGLVIGIPLTFSGLRWMFFKTAVQQTNCLSDLYAGVGDASARPTSQQPDLVVDQFNNYGKCLENVDPKLGTLRFVRDQANRN